MMKFSIIVPIHNTKQYLEKCLNSLLGQTLEEIEIILVDDYSTDGSADIIKDAYNNHPDKIVPIFLEKNMKQGAARNRGIKAARGEYIAFVDSDDWVELNMCEEMYKTAKEYDADIVNSNYFIFKNGKDIAVTQKYTNSDVGRMNNEKLIYYTHNSGFFVTSCYKRSFLQKNNITFPENVFYEDMYFNYVCPLYAKIIAKNDGHYYHYFQRDSSTTHQRNNESCYDKIKITQLILDDCKERGLMSIYGEEIEYKYFSSMAYLILHTCLKQFDKPDIKRLEEVRRAINKYCPDYRKNKYYYMQSPSLRFYFRVNQLSPKLVVLTYRLRIGKIVNICSSIKRRFWRWSKG